MQQSWKAKEIAGVPDGLILFDGVCHLCSGWVRFLIERDPAGHFRFTPIQSPYGRALAVELGIDPENPETNAVIRDGCAYFKFESIMHTLGRVPYWRWVRAGAVLPRPLRNWLYDRIAKNRYRMFGRSESCMIPTPEVLRRFIFENPAGEHGV